MAKIFSDVFTRYNAIPDKSTPPIPEEKQQAIKDIIPKINEMVALGSFLSSIWCYFKLNNFDDITRKYSAYGYNG